MPLLLPITRYMLILIPAIASMYLVDHPSYAMYVFLILIFIWIAELRRTLMPQSTFMLLLEIGFGAWLCHTYGGILFFLFYSTLMSYLFTIKHHIRYSCLLLQLTLLNLSLAGQSVSSYVMANVIFLSLTFLLLHMYGIKQNKEEVELLNDTLRRQHYELNEARAQLIDYARKVENIAQTEERNRISRDIHDELGHKLIRLKMMTEAVLQILPVQQSKGMEMLTSVRDQLTESMDLLRSTVRRMKPDEDEIRTYSLRTLIDQLTKDKGIIVEVEMEGMPYALYPSLEFILYRNAQEAITNAIRHGAATQVLIQLTYEPKQVTMSISNNGERPEQAGVKGLGITGMEERSKLIGGKLYVTVNDRFVITTVLPTFRQIDPT
ncbi:sensor histidine kinase [Paenibacillus sp. N3.4]|uniref:sensor histidine kinase n=1 Tax=Paenibacillus sp. N3.4 TaxID=2603222 RepID=UPI0011C9726C|nr:sensor histidine kinase [Paenibacillus sp. N3.4]TXK85778.1 sensor histidine kinase [Paenibacillus sp. N3.4]